MNDDLLNRLVQVAEDMVDYDYDAEDVRYVANWPEVVQAIVESAPKIIDTLR